MPRTTLHIDDSVLRAVKRIAREQRRTVGEVVSELLALAIGKAPQADRRLRWKTQEMSARVDLEDKDAVYRAIDAE
jgi:hypothetical protein